MNQEIMSQLANASGYLSVALGAVGSALGCGIAGMAAIGAWKKCFVQNKPTPFQLMIFAGCPLSQTIYGMILMFSLLKGNSAAWVFYLGSGILSGLAIGVSAMLQGKACASACDAFSETGKGFANQMVVICIVETVAIFVMAFCMVLLSSFGA